MTIIDQLCEQNINHTKENNVLIKNYEGEERHIGFEIEYAGLPLDIVAKTVCDLFGGSVKKHNVTQYDVKETELGDFVLELDSIPLQKLADSNKAFKDSEDLYNKTQYQLGKTINEFGAKIVPYEIVCPPAKISEIPKLQSLCDALRAQGAKGTKSSILYAFGLHLNPEIVATDSKYLTKHLQSFLLLSKWLEKEHTVDLSRRLTSFIDPFPASYYKLILNNEYQVDIETLIRDYHAHNPSRNRALDMLPLFAHINETLVRGLYGEEEKINKRPTFHYRLPNCELSQPDWSLNLEWQRWLNVEKIANDNNLLLSLIDKWQRHEAKLLASEADWIAEVDEWIVS